MRGRTRKLFVIVGAAAVVAGVLVGSAGATQRASAARLKTLAQVKVPLPAPAHAAVVAVTLKVTAPKGKSVGALSVRVANPAAVKGADAEAVAALPPASRKRSATLTIYVAMFRGNKGAADKGALAAQGESMLMPIVGPVVDSIQTGPGVRIHLNAAECSGLPKQDVPKEQYKTLVTFSPETAEHQWDVDAEADCGSQAEPVDQGD
jgi:hypothetical protein